MSGYLQRLIARNLDGIHEIHSTAKLPYAELSIAQQDEPLLDHNPARSSQPAATSLESQPDLINEKDTHKKDSVIVAGIAEDLEEQEYPTPIKEHNQNAPFQVDENQKLSIQRETESNKTSTINPIMQQKLKSLENNTLEEKKERRIVENVFTPLIKIARQRDIQPQSRLENPKNNQPVTVIKPFFTNSLDQTRIIGASNQSNEDSNEVHVTIGRIEITAVHAPQPSKPVSTPVRKSNSLEEYLAKRSRRS